MKKLTRYIVKKFISDWENTKNQQVRSRYGSLEGWTSIISNIVFTVLKAVLGLITGSISLMADAFHSFSDVSTSFVIIIIYRLSNKPPDKNHPYGHGRMEAVGTVIVSFILMFIGLELLKTGFHHLIHPRAISVSWIVVVIVIIFIGIKEILARFAYELGTMIDSDAIKADSWHHRTDAISSIVVVVALGAQNFNIYFIDGLATIIIAFMIGYIGIKFLLKGIDELLGKSATGELVQKVKKVVRDLPQVFDTHDLIIHRYGQNIIGSIHIELSDQLSLQAAHTIAERVENKLKSIFGMHITAHIDPVDVSNPKLKKIRSFLKNFAEQERNFKFHDLRIKNYKGKAILIMDVAINSQINKKEVKKLTQRIEKLIKKNFLEIDKVNCEIDPEFML
ncbi:MAG: cation diffusion facilitator family transporter [bacterium]